MKRLLLVMLGAFALAAPPAAAQQLLFDGEVVGAGTDYVVQLSDTAAVPLGSVVYAFEPVAVGEREVAVLRGTYRTVGADGRRLRVVPVDTEGRPSVLQAGQRVQVDFAQPPGLVDVTSSPVPARVSWLGIPLGTTPLTALELVPGAYTFYLEAAGYEPTPLTLDVLPATLSAYDAPLIDAPTARDLFREAWRLYEGGRYAEARAALDRALEPRYGPLPDDLTAEEPLLRDLIVESEGLDQRGQVAGVPAEVVREAAGWYRLYRRNVEPRGNAQAVRQAVDALYRLLPDDPLATRLYQQHPPPAPVPVGGGR